jgi:hypothetical protein
MPQALLQGYAGNILEERIFSFPLGQLRTRLAVREPLAGLLVLMSARGQSVIESPAYTAKELFQSPALPAIRVKSKAVSDFHGRDLAKPCSANNMFKGTLMCKTCEKLFFITSSRWLECIWCGGIVVGSTF